MKYWDYTLRGRSLGEGWAKILITEDGRFHAISDYGNFAYWWTSIGEGRTILEFVHGICDDPYYICQKLKPERVLIAAASFKALLEEVIARRKDDWSQEKARSAWDLIKYYAVENDWQGYVEDGETHLHFEAPWEYAVSDYTSDIQAFAKYVMPALAPLLLKDIPAARRRLKLKAKPAVK